MSVVHYRKWSCECCKRQFVDTFTPEEWEEASILLGETEGGEDWCPDCAFAEFGIVRP